jgi:hypothetical protein
MTMRSLLLTLLVVTLCGCAAPQRESSRDSTSPRVRCLADPHETGTRPLVFLLCIESP